ncbi:hypothetical protein TNCV_1979561 [Trichonephila clavipes]|nr:hypothetical protein TNCV_1979561 [Trichonephila clavipes]
MSFGLLGTAPNFQTIDIILKPVIGKFVPVYMDDVIIASQSFEQQAEHLREVFRLLQEADLTLNQQKCRFEGPNMCNRSTTIKAFISRKRSEGVLIQGSHSELATPVLQGESDIGDETSEEYTQSSKVSWHDSHVEENHETWDQSLKEFAYLIRTAVHEMTGKMSAELFLGRKLITPFQKLVMVSDGSEVSAEI